MRAISPDTSQPQITQVSSKIMYLEFHSNLPGVNELLLDA